jgi:hypothetical protein
MTTEPRLSSHGVAAWWLVIAVFFTAIVGVVAGKLLFSEIKLVEKPVEVVVEKKVEVPVEVIKTVEKRVEVPVEVIKTVEKRVEVPAVLTEYQQTAVKVVDAILEAEKRKAGIGDTAIFPAANKEVKIMVHVYDDAKPYISVSEVRARVESLFRREGFKVYAEDGPSADTFIYVNLNLLSTNDGRTLSGTLSVDIDQLGTFWHGGLWKRAFVTTNRYYHAISYGSNHFGKIPAEIESLAIRASNDLAKAGPTPLFKK